MKSFKSKRLLALILALVMLLGMVPAVYAAEDSGAESESEDEIVTIDLKDYALISYESYAKKYGLNDEKTLESLRTGKSASVAGTDFDEGSTGVEIGEVEGRECADISDTSNVTWTIDVPETGAYCVKFTYCSTSEKTTDIERVFKINGKAICSESRYQKFYKTWTYNYLTESEAKESSPDVLELRKDAQNGNIGYYSVDMLGNENRTTASVCRVWQEYSVTDPNGYYNKPLELYLTAGENTITLEGVRDSMAIGEVSVYTYEPLKTYSEVLAEYEANGYKAAENSTIKLEAELPTAVSNYTIYPIYDRVSAISSPQDATKVYRNEIGGDKWETNGQWIKYNFTVEETGLYQIEFRYLQDTLTGLYSSRAIKINGEYPFEEAKNCQFAYNSDWQNEAASNGDYTFAFYFEKGETYELEVEVNLGNFANVARQVSYTIEDLNDDYMSILELAGSDPDTNRDYGFVRIMPDVIKDIALQSSILYDLVDFIVDENGVESENTSVLQAAAAVCEKMASEEKEIAGSLSALKDQITALGTWLSDISAQYLEMDYITISPYESEVAPGLENGWQTFVFEMSKLFRSFFTDYNKIGSVETQGEMKSTITAWTSSGRDQSQIMKNLISSGYTRTTGNNVIVKLVDGGTMLPAILTGTGPDMSLDAGAPLDYAIRGAVMPLNEYEGFDEVMTRFSDSASITITLYGKTYALPTSQDCQMMFVRDDIISELGMDVPETWDELLAMIPVLQFNNMQIGMGQDAIIFLYQRGYKYWRDEGMATNLDSHEYLEAFEDVCDFFTQYSLPVSYNAQNLFKTGEMPIMMSAYTFYNTLAIFAPEISGLWHFYEVPGTVREDGTIDHSTISGVSGVWMPKGCKDEENTWKFMKWITDVEYQVGYSDEMVALLGPSAKQAVANLEALEQLPWTESEYKMIQKCLKNTKAVEPYPGSYYLGRWVGFAFRAAYNEGKDPTTSLLQYIDTINAELTRKRTEFELMTEDMWIAIKAYTGYEDFSEWRQYFADEYGYEYDSSACIQDIQEFDDDHYTYVNWMSEHNVSVKTYEDWVNETENGKTTQSYKDWLAKG